MDDHYSKFETVKGDEESQKLDFSPIKKEIEESPKDKKRDYSHVNFESRLQLQPIRGKTAQGKRRHS
jgi:hypothetical protein